MIHARVDVELRFHERAHRAGTAMGTWTWALLDTRAKEGDGYVSRIALRGAWAGERQARRDMAKLVEVGLATPHVDPEHGEGWILRKYAPKNETRDEIRARREADARRQRAWRGSNESEKIPRLSRRDEGVTNDGPSPLVTRTESESESESDRSPSRACERERTRVAGPGPDLAMPSWAGEVVEAVALTTGVTLADPPSLWAVFAAVCLEKGRSHDRSHWQTWVTREARQRATRAARGPVASVPEPELRAAYETGLREALGAAAVVWTSASVGELVAAVEGHARSRSTGAALEGEKRVAWVEAAAADFGAWLVAHPSEAKYLGDGSPAGFVRWLARDRLTREATEIDGNPPKRRHA